MKYFFSPILFLVFGLQCLNAQVGINTNNPQAALDVNGNVRVRAMGTAALSGVDITTDAVRLIGVDAQGNMVPVHLSDNVRLEGGSIVAKRQRLEFGTLPTLIIPPDGIIDNLNIVILPGDRNEGKSIIKIEHPNPSTNPAGRSVISISGIVAAPDGTQIWLYPTNADLELLPLNSDSFSANQIQVNNQMMCRQYSMIRLIYDAAIRKWVIMNHHG